MAKQNRVMLYRPDQPKDKSVVYCETFEEARRRATELNQRLIESEGIPRKAPFTFYYPCSDSIASNE
jgi:hypothetical protein